MNTDYVSGTTTTTSDPPNGMLLHIYREGAWFVVKDYIGLRYGCGVTLEEAVSMWAEDVQGVCDEKNAGGALLSEQCAYRAALAGNQP